MSGVVEQLLVVGVDLIVNTMPMAWNAKGISNN